MEDIKKNQIEIFRAERYNNQIKKLSGWGQIRMEKADKRICRHDAQPLFYRPEAEVE